MMPRKSDTDDEDGHKEADYKPAHKPPMADKAPAKPYVPPKPVSKEPPKTEAPKKSPVHDPDPPEGSAKGGSKEDRNKP